MASKKILIVAGEPSGDLHASNLVKDLKAINPNVEFFGLGGSLSKKAGVEVIFDISQLALIGAVEVFKNIFTVGKVYKMVLSKIDSVKPDIAILVDYPGFNLRLAGELKKRSIPVIYYVSPQVWVWGRDRINIIKRCVRKILVFFKFEEELYRTYGMDAEFVGNPLLDAVKITMDPGQTRKRHGLAEGKTTIALLPGSRKMEIQSLLGTMISSARAIRSKLGNVQFVIAKHPDLARELYEDALNAAEFDIRLAEGDTYNVLAASDFAIVASGSATLETAIIGTPFVIIYRVSFITFLLYKLVATISFLGLVNIIAGREVVPELLQYNATPEKISAESIRIITDKKRNSVMREDLKRVVSCLGSPGASKRAALAILPYLK